MSITLFKRICMLILFGLAGPVFVLSAEPAEGPEGEREYNAVEIGGTLCGYSESWSTTVTGEGRTLRREEARVQILLSVLGAGVDTSIHTVFLMDPATGQVLSCDLTIEQGPVKAGASVSINGQTARWTPKAGGEPRDIQLSPDVILGVPGYHPGLYRDFVQQKKEKMEYRMFDIMRGEIQNTTCVLTGREALTLAGSDYNALMVEEFNAGTGLKTSMWLDTGRDRILKTAFLNRVFYLADVSVKKRIQRVSLDNSLFAKTNVTIKDIYTLEYLKVKAALTTAGERVTAESLNVPGQRFTGTVKDNVINGIFEISHPCYDGRGAPPFPPRLEGDSALLRYLKPEKLIESDDPALVAKALELTAGAAGSWDAARRLSRWVADEIGYDLPGGSTARLTFEKRLGECGGHSRLLTALCRGAGIPARVVTGCMYTYTKGGSFGQHAWTEVYMGKAGWVPVDSTAVEIDYVDAGHIRLGEEAMFMPESMEILDYRCTAGTAGAGPAPALLEKFTPYLGCYSLAEAPAGRGMFQIMIQNGSLALDIPGRMVCELKEPGPDGVWYLKITNRAGVRFRRDDSGKADGMAIMEYIQLPPAEPAAPPEAGAPDAWQPYLGQYRIPMNQGTARVLHRDGQLAIEIPRRGLITLKEPDAKGRWYDRRETGAFISFDQDATGKVTMLNLFFGEYFPRGVLAAHLVEKALQEGGWDAALEKYRELKQNPPEECQFTENSFNFLGYRLLGQNQIDEAVAVFELNAAAYSASANVYDSLGEALLKKGDKARALENYEKALQLDPKNGNARQAIDKIKSGQ